MDYSYVLASKMSANIDLGVGADEAARAEEVRPILDADLPADLKRRFEVLMDEMRKRVYEDDDIEAAYEHLFNRIRSEVTENPVLAKTVSKIFLGWSLLTTLCEKHPGAYRGVERALQFLIEQNPHALVWQCGDTWSPSCPIRIISRDHCAIMPWIAEHYSWALDHPVCQQNPPHLELISTYNDGGCDASLVRQFYESYPQGLAQENRIVEDGLPIHKCISGWREGEADLIKWMARQNPDSMTHQDRFGLTPLHCACLALAGRRSTDNMAEICRFLATECPESVRLVNARGCLPIHFITKRANRPAVQSVLLTLLREYPQSVNMAADNTELHPSPWSVPFIQRIGPLLQEELALEGDIVFLADTSNAWSEATHSSQDIFQATVSNIYKKWSTLRRETFMQRSATIPGLIADACRECAGDDPSDSDDGSLSYGEVDDDDGSFMSDDDDSVMSVENVG